MMYTSSLDVAHKYPRRAERELGRFLLGVTEQAINAETRIALAKFRSGLAGDSLESADL